MSSADHACKQTERRLVGRQYARFRVARRGGAALAAVVAAGAALAGSAQASAPWLTKGLTSVAPAPSGGSRTQVDDTYYAQNNAGDWRLLSRGRTLVRGGAPVYDDFARAGTIVARPGGGYWVVDREGVIAARGGAPQLCGGDLATCSGYSYERCGRILAAAPTPTGNGLWAVDSGGAVWTAGDAQSYGDVTGAASRPTGIVASPSGHGYAIVEENGTVHVRGDATNWGSFRGRPPYEQKATGIALSRDANGVENGYWLSTEDGRVHPFGRAPFLGDAGGGTPTPASTVTYLVGIEGGTGYMWAHADGRIGRSS